MANVRKRSMKKQCYDIIKHKILTQEFDLGESINIAALSNQLSVSNSPIREALALLEADGLVTSTLNAKVRVIAIDQAFMSELSQTVCILLTGAYDLCVETGKTGALIEQMRESVARQKALIDTGDFFAFTAETVAFDRCILEALGNRNLLNLFDSIASLLFLVYRTHHQRDEKERLHSIIDHAQILDGIIVGDHDAVKRQLKAHNNKTI